MNRIVKTAVAAFLASSAKRSFTNAKGTFKIDFELNEDGTLSVTSWGYDYATLTLPANAKEAGLLHKQNLCGLLFSDDMNPGLKTVANNLYYAIMTGFQNAKA